MLCKKTLVSQISKKMERLKQSAEIQDVQTQAKKPKQNNNPRANECDQFHKDMRAPSSPKIFNPATLRGKT